jgi:hypothetical protein
MSIPTIDSQVSTAAPYGSGGAGAYGGLLPLVPPGRVAADGADRN